MSAAERGEVRRALWALSHPFALAAALGVAVNLLLLTPTVYLLQVYDRVLAGQSEMTLLAVSALAVASLAVLAGAEALRSRVLVGLGLRLDQRLSPQVFEAAFWQQAGPAGADAQRPFDDLTQLRQFLTGPGILALFDAPWAPLYLAVLWLLHPLLGLLGLGFVLAQALLVWLGHQRSLAPAQAAGEATAQAARFLDGKLRNAALVEAMGMLVGLQGRWQALHDRAAARASTAQAQAQRISAWSKWLRYSQQSLGLAVGALLVIDSQLSPGAMIATSLLLTRALAPVDQFVSGWRGWVAARAAFTRLEGLLAAPLPPSTGLAKPPLRGVLTLAGASAAVPGQERLLLQPLQLSLKPGTVLVVQGPSGSGKSTLARLMLGPWPAAAGAVLFDERPLAEWDATALGAQRGYLPQDVALMDGSVADNIARHGTPDADRVLDAARSAGLHELILRFPKGYDTPVGEAGEALSAGQRQRIGLARALYGEPTLVVLDEPDAHLDELGELALRLAVLAMKARGCTVVLISHHPALAALADRRLLLAEGRVASDEPL